MNRNVDWEEPFCGAGANCFRLGTDVEGNAYIAIAGQEDHPSPTPVKPSRSSFWASRQAEPTTSSSLDVSPGASRVWGNDHDSPGARCWRT